MCGTRSVTNYTGARNSCGVCNFLKTRGRVPKQTCSQSAVRGVSTHDVEERVFNEQPSRVTRWWIHHKSGKHLRDDKARSRTRINIKSVFQR